MAFSGPEHRRLLDKLTREVLRIEHLVVEQPAREARRIGDVPPVQVLRELAAHVHAMRPRFEAMVDAHGLVLHRFGVGAFTTLRHLVIDRVADPERSYRTTLIDLRHGLDVVKLLREAAWREELFGLIRWCDDWLGARRTLVARAEAQLAWFAQTEDRGARDAPARPEPRVEPATALHDDEDDLARRSPPRDPEHRPWP